MRCSSARKLSTVKSSNHPALLQAWIVRPSSARPRLPPSPETAQLPQDPPQTIWFQPTLQTIAIIRPHWDLPRSFTVVRYPTVSQGVGGVRKCIVVRGDHGRTWYRNNEQDDDDENENGSSSNDRGGGWESLKVGIAIWSKGVVFWSKWF